MSTLDAEELRGARLFSLISLVIMLSTLGMMVLRPRFPQLVGDYFGLIQRFFYFGWSLWFAALSVNFTRLPRSPCSASAESNHLRAS